MWWFLQQQDGKTNTTSIKYDAIITYTVQLGYQVHIII